MRTATLLVQSAQLRRIKRGSQVMQTALRDIHAQRLLILDFGSHTQLIARRVRECGVYCEIYPSISLPMTSTSMLLRASFYPAVRKPLPKAPPHAYLSGFLRSAYPFWASAMACRPWRFSSAARLLHQISGNLVTRRSKPSKTVRCSTRCLQTLSK